MRTLATTLLILLLASTSAPLAAATIAFSVNSDSNTQNEDSLYRIDLEAGSHSLVSKVTPSKIDVEGLAFAPDETLYAFDDETRTLFTLNKVSAAADTLNQVTLTALPIGGRNDVGMTFACDGTLYMTSVATNKLYRVSLSGDVEEIGSIGVDINISGIAAYGNPTRLYGLGNGNVASPMLYEIHTGTGAASPVGTLGGLANPYNEGGLDFDASGQLWAVTDRRIPDELGSQVLRIDVDRNSDMVIEARTLVEVGFESLAITPPAGCDTVIEPPEPPSIEPPDSEHQYKGVPALSPLGLALASLLLLLTGLFASRRF